MNLDIEKTHFENVKVIEQNEQKVGLLIKMR